MERINKCPVCDKEEFKLFLNCLDHTVSRETFSIVQCISCNFKFTNPRPNINVLGNYYKSEEYISHSNTKKGFVNSTYQIVRKYTLLKKLQLISKFFKTGNLLDIGCGTGEFLNVFKEAKWSTVGIEPDLQTRENASQKYSLNIYPEEYLKQLKSESFEIITMWHVLEHVPFLNERIQDIKRLIKQNGIIIIAVPNCNSLDAEIYKEHWAAYDVPRHLYHFTPQTLELVFKKHGLKLFNTLPMIFDSFYVSMLSEKIKSGKTGLICSMWNGLRSNINAIKTGKKYSSQIYLIRK
jgi:2-polyprenyl-3-methyl-5-hydroxy-6-metoxy-1,4-benzoquinol methylase